MSVARGIDLVAGIGFLVLGLWALLPLTGGMLMGVLPVNPLLAVMLMVLGVLLLYGTLSTEVAHSVSAVVGVLLLLAAVSALSGDLFGLIPVNGWTTALFVVAAAPLLYDWLGTPDPAESAGS